jgi:D-beta-D-heptose 7-phosphate kinase / D-beta-D-heptose 1-phosphate adenosyltransferase
MRLVVVGDALLDRDLDGRAERLCPDAPVPVVDDPEAHARPGGAGLAATLAATDGREVALITPLSGDRGGRELARLLADGEVDLVALELDSPTPEKLRVRAAGRSIVRIDRGGRVGRVGPLTAAASAALEGADAVLVSDYGRGVTAERTVREALQAAVQRTPVVWDPHPNGAKPVSGVRLATPNRGEARRLVMEPQGQRLAHPHAPGGLAAVAEQAGALLRRWNAGGVAVTLGARGALLVAPDGTPLAVPAPRVVGGDPCGAGDRFASAAAGLLGDGALTSEAVTHAVAAASAFVAAGGAAAAFERREPPGQGAAAEEVIARTRAAGGTVVATGGCFDLLHAGHLRMLSSARALGDCLIVCLNSDESVRQLKGSGRPLVTQEDRATVLLGLGCVDAVAVFDEDTPEAILDRLRPDVWAKGADYAVADLPEAAVLRRWGGQAVVLPYVAGHSTTRLIEEAARHG